MTYSKHYDAIAVTFGLKRLPAAPPKVRVIPNAKGAWARYAIHQGVSFRVYALGFQLLDGTDSDTWVNRGFDALLEHVGKL